MTVFVLTESMGRQVVRTTVFRDRKEASGALLARVKHILTSNDRWLGRRNIKGTRRVSWARDTPEDCPMPFPPDRHGDAAMVAVEVRNGTIELVIREAELKE